MINLTSILSKAYLTVFLSAVFVSLVILNMSMYADRFQAQNMPPRARQSQAFFANDTGKVACPSVPLELRGTLNISLTQPMLNWTQIEAENAENLIGGRYSPPDCKSRHKVAILVPYKDRDKELRIFLHHIHAILKRQKLSYGIYVIEQAGDTHFNRAMMFNIGFKMAMQLTNDYWDCFVFHDVDLLPEDDRNLYTCPTKPRHMSVAIDKFNYKLPYKDIFGGVSAMTTQDFLKVNGFSNRYWGWGGEDDDMRLRLKKVGLEIARYSPDIARYTMIRHSQAPKNPERHDILKDAFEFFTKDGISNLNFTVVQIVEKRSLTMITVAVNQISDSDYKREMLGNSTLKADN